MPSEDFLCYLVTKENGRTRGEVCRRGLADLPEGEVLVRVAYSSLNYKDALSATGQPGVTRKFPHVPGIDAVGVVVESRSPRWREGAEVIVTGFDQGQNTWGGFAEYIRVRADWIVALPAGLTLRESMALGTAGLTAGLCVRALIEQGLSAESGEIAVTGASGGVGSLAVGILGRLGWQVTASTGKAAAHDLLMRLGARSVVGRDEVADEEQKPLLPARWAGAVDTVGGKTLASLIRASRPDGCVTACGLVGGTELPLTVYPFILRGVRLVGIDSAQCPIERREQVWSKLAGEWKPAELESLTTEVRLDELDASIQAILAGEVIGRTVVVPSAQRRS